MFDVWQYAQNKDVLTDSGWDEVLYDYASKIYRSEDYADESECLSCLVAVEFFPDVRFNTILEEYLKTKGKSLEDIRGYYAYGRGFLMTHGENYSWKDADLLCGNGDGQTLRDFEKWVEKTYDEEDFM